MKNRGGMLEFADIVRPYLAAGANSTAHSVAGCIERGLKVPQLVVEPGRSIAGPAGIRNSA